jgi:protoporphyrinogen oxidase
MSSYAIVGGGMLGMTLALRLTDAGHDVTMYESAPRCGGLAAPWRLGPITWDRHYHVTLFSDLALRELLGELGLAGEFHWVTTKTGFFVDGTLHSFSHVLDFLRFPPLTPIEKARLGYTILAASRITDWKALERVRAVDWLAAYSGRSTVEKIWLPLLRAKLGTYAEQASAAFIWAVIVRMYAARRTGAKRELFGYVSGGYDTIVRRFEEVLAQRRVRVELSSRIDSVQQRGGRLAVLRAEREEHFDNVVVTLAAPLAARLCPQLQPKERERCAGVEYQGIVCASILTDRPISPYYITNITDAWVPFTAVIEMTALVDPATFGGRSLIYLPKYAPAGDPIFAMSDDECGALFLGALERMYPHFSRTNVEALRVSRVPYVMPVPTLRYSERVPQLRTSIPGLYLTGSAQIVNGTLNVNETVMLANRVARALLTDDVTAADAVSAHLAV